MLKFRFTLNELSRQLISISIATQFQVGELNLKLSRHCPHTSPVLQIKLSPVSPVQHQCPCTSSHAPPQRISLPRICQESLWPSSIANQYVVWNCLNSNCRSTNKTESFPRPRTTWGRIWTMVRSSHKTLTMNFYSSLTWPFTIL